MNQRLDRRFSSISENVALSMRTRDVPEGEYLHCTATALELAVGALLDSLGADAPLVGIRKVQVGQRVGFGILGGLGPPRDKAVYLLAGQMVELACEGRVPFVKDRVEDAEHCRFLLPGGALLEV